MSNTQHTPIPWVVSGHCGDHIRPTTPNAAPLALALASDDTYDSDTYRANAEFIVRACNAHDSLVAACGGCVDAITELVEAEEPSSTDWVNVRASRRVARTVIDQAEDPGTCRTCGGIHPECLTVGCSDRTHCLPDSPEPFLHCDAHRPGEGSPI